MPGKSRPTVIVTHTLPKDWISSLEEQCTLFSGPSDATQLHPSLLQHLPNVEGLFTLLTIPVTEHILDQAPKLRVVSNMAVGVDNIDIKACSKRRIPVGNTPGVLTESTADLTLALILSSARNIPQASNDAAEGRWNTWRPAGWLGMELNGSTLGIVGMGKIGKAVARRALGFGMKILYYDPLHVKEINASKVSIEELLMQSDIISLHAPLTSETRGMINESALSQMKSSAILINAARGALVDTNALVNALEHKTIAAVALDVTDPEPLPSSHPLYGFPNCLIVPHIGSATQFTRRQMAKLACENLLSGLRGERLPHCVNPDVYN
jgi:lactate dehydrogenase-like 2-hydroxyacid dehydrogenase